MLMISTSSAAISPNLTARSIRLPISWPPFAAAAVARGTGRGANLDQRAGRSSRRLIELAATRR